MQATRVEFEQRFWFIGAIFFLGFSTSFFTHTPLAAALANRLAPGHEETAVRVVFALGTLLALACALIRTWATAYLRPEVVHDAAQHSDHLVAAGPFRHVRNPLYLATILMATGIATLAPPFGWLFIVLALTIFLVRLINREEAALAHNLGEPYLAYQRAVPKLLPSPTPRLPRDPALHPAWPQALCAEVVFFLFAIAMLLLTITLNLSLSGMIFLLSLPIYFLTTALARRARRPA